MQGEEPHVFKAVALRVSVISICGIALNGSCGASYP
jgi:hypothetical protein